MSDIGIHISGRSSSAFLIITLIEIRKLLPALLQECRFKKKDFLSFFILLPNYFHHTFYSSTYVREHLQTMWTAMGPGVGLLLQEIST